MKILVCFKIAPDLESVLSSDWDQADGRPLDLSYVRRCIGPYEEAALEMALRLADELRSSGQSVEVHALTIDSNDICSFTANLFAIQIKRIIQIPHDSKVDFSPESLSRIIASFVRKEGGYDWIFMGQQSTIGENAQTHLRTGEALHMPILTNVIDLSMTTRGTQVKSLLSTGILLQNMQGPAVLAVGNSAHPFLRIATLRERLAAKNSKIEVLELNELGNELVSEPHLEAELVKLFSEQKTRCCRWIEGHSSEEKASVLYESFLEGALQT